MSSLLSEKITLWLIHKGAIAPTERALYQYASFLVIYTMTPIAIVLLGGLILGISPIKCLLFSFCFITLKKYAGGFHFNSRNICSIVSTLVEMSFLYLSNIVQNLLWSTISAIISAISILVWSPIISPERSILRLNRNHSKILVLRTLVIFTMIIGVLYISNLDIYIPPIEYAIIMTSLIQYPVVIRERLRHDSNICD